MEKRELQLAEEGAGSPVLDAQQQSQSYTEDKGSGAKHGYTNGHSRDVQDWDGLVAKARTVGKQWKRAWERDGLSGCLRITIEFHTSVLTTATSADSHRALDNFSCHRRGGTRLE